MKEAEPKHEHYLRQHKDAEDISQLSENLAPPEEILASSQKEQTGRDDEGPLVMDTGSFKLAPGFVEDEQETRGIFGLQPVILVILILMLMFIAFIAYLIYKSPGK